MIRTEFLTVFTHFPYARTSDSAIVGLTESVPHRSTASFDDPPAIRFEIPQDETNHAPDVDASRPDSDHDGDLKSE
jgi:hypothetical protein